LDGPGPIRVLKLGLKLFIVGCLNGGVEIGREYGGRLNILSNALSSLKQCFWKVSGNV
jgi:hypothetical protein